MQTKTETDVRDHFKFAGTVADDIASAIAEYLRFGSAPPLALVLLTQAQRALVEAANAIGDMLTPDVVPADEEPPSHVEAKRSKASGEHRHKFGPDNRCTVTGCGKVKSANGRKPAGAPAAEAPPADARTMPLPIPPLGDAAADRFAGGAHGSSGVVRR